MHNICYNRAILCVVALSFYLMETAPDNTIRDDNADIMNKRSVSNLHVLLESIMFLWDTTQH